MSEYLDYMENAGIEALWCRKRLGRGPTRVSSPSCRNWRESHVPSKSEQVTTLPIAPPQDPASPELG